MKIRNVLLVLALLVVVSAFRNQKKTWVALGDSITYLNDHADETGNRVSKGYMSRVVEQLPDLEYINQGHNGWTASQIARQIDSLGLQKADVYSVLLGTNDWWGGVPVGQLSDYQQNTGAATVYGAFRIIVNKFRSLNPAAAIILMTPMQRVDFVYVNDMHNNAFGSYRKKNDQSLAQVATAILTIARTEHCAVVDLYNKSGMVPGKLVKFKHLRDSMAGTYRNYPYPAFVNKPFNPDSDEYPYPPEAAGYTYDGLHPSDKGNQVIASMLVKELRKIK